MRQWLHEERWVMKKDMKRVTLITALMLLISVVARAQMPGGATPVPEPAPIPTTRPTPPPDHLSNLSPGASLPSDASCTTMANASAFPETVPQNVNDGTGWNNNHQLWTTPSYFYANAGGSVIGFSNSDFTNVNGNYAGSTLGIMRWAACKWGVDEDWVYAQSYQEDGQRQDCAALHGGTGCRSGGDCGHPDGSDPTTTANLSFMGFATTSSAGHFIGPNAITSTCGQPYASWGIIQTKAQYAEWYTWPMLAISTAWNEDYRWAKYRACVNGDSAKVTYFTSQNEASGADYSAAISRATSRPNGAVPGGQLGPTNLFAGETNLQYLALGCMATHFSGGWYDSGASTYAGKFIGYLNAQDWPGGR